MKVKIRKDKSLDIHTLCITFHDINNDYLDKIKSILICYLHKIKVYTYDHDEIYIYTYDIYYAEVIENKVYLYTKEDCYRIYKTFSSIRNDFSTYGLKQINKNTLVNSLHVVRIHIEKDCKRVLTLDNGEKLVISRRFRLVV